MNKNQDEVFLLLGDTFIRRSSISIVNFTIKKVDGDNCVSAQFVISGISVPYTQNIFLINPNDSLLEQIKTDMYFEVLSWMNNTSEVTNLSLVNVFKECKKKRQLIN